MNLDIEFHEKGYKNIAGIDEVGRGCLCGDVVACSIIMKKDSDIKGIKDSKKVTEKKRNELFDKILMDSIAVGIGRVDNNIIDQINIKEATRLAMKKSVENLRTINNESIKPDLLLIDAEEIYLDIPQESIIKGDNLSYSIACASIIAKVYRDRICKDWDTSFPGYNIIKNKGYGTREHRTALLEKGPSAIHRKTFIKKILKKEG